MGIGPGALVLGLLILGVAALVLFVLLRKPAADSALGTLSTDKMLPAAASEPIVATSSTFDLELTLDASPLGLTFRGADMILTNRYEPWGLVVVQHHDGKRFDQVKRPVIESTYRQRVGLSTITWNGSHLVGTTEGSWVQASAEDVFLLIDPDTLSIVGWHPAPPLLGGLVWDGDGYWAATRRNTEDADEPVFLYRLDTDLEVVDRFEPPAVGCQGLAVHDDRLYFADVFSGTLAVLDVSVRPPRLIERIATGLDYLSGVGHDGDHLWLAEYGDNRLLRLGLRSAAPPGVLEARAETPVTPSQPVSLSPAGEGESLDELRAGLRSEDQFERMHAEAELRRRGVPPDFDREEDSFPDSGPEDVSVRWWQAEMSEGTITASWELFFGEALFSRNAEHRDGPVTVPLFARYTIEIEGGDLARPVQHELDARPGVQTIRNQVLASDLGRGSYRIGLLVHVQYVQPDGGAKIYNTSALPLEVGW